MTGRDSAEIPVEHLRMVAEIAKGEIFEPFEGSVSLERIRDTQQNLKTGIDKVKSAWDKIYEKNQRAGSATYRQLKKKTDGLFGKIMPRGNPEKGGTGMLAPSMKKIEGWLGDLKDKAKSGSQNLGKVAKDKSVDYVRKAFELLMAQNGEEWTVGVARETLKRDDLVSLADVAGLGLEERQILVEAHYPYSGRILKRHAETFDYGVNLLMGSIVATNLPFTGAAVCLFNMGRTIVRTANRVHCLSHLYGRPVPSKEALYSLTAEILASINDWDANPEHEPLKTEGLDAFYASSAREDFDSLLKQIVLRDNYIAIPLVGTVSLAKLNLDDFKVDLHAKNLFRRHSLARRLAESYPAALLAEELEAFRQTFREQAASNRLEKIKRAFLKDKLLSSSNDSAAWLKIDRESLRAIHETLLEEALERYLAERPSRS